VLAGAVLTALALTACGATKHVTTVVTKTVAPPVPNDGAAYGALTAPVNAAKDAWFAEMQADNYANSYRDSLPFQAAVSTFDAAILRLSGPGQTAIDIRAVVSYDEAAVADLGTETIEPGDDDSPFSQDFARAEAASASVRSDLGLPPDASTSASAQASQTSPYNTCEQFAAQKQQVLVSADDLQRQATTVGAQADYTRAPAGLVAAITQDANAMLAAPTPPEDPQQFREAIQEVLTDARAQVWSDLLTVAEGLQSGITIANC
jgi:hypothetical protein